MNRKPTKFEMKLMYNKFKSLGLSRIESRILTGWTASLQRNAIHHNKKSAMNYALRNRKSILNRMELRRRNRK